MTRPGVGQPLRPMLVSVALSETQWKQVIAALRDGPVRRAIVRQFDRRVHTTVEMREGDVP